MAAAVFFLLRRFRLLREGTLTTDLFVDLHEGPAQLLILAELGNLPLGLALRRRGGKAFRHRLAPHFPGEAERGAMPPFARLVTMTARGSATPSRSRNRAGPKIPQLGNL